MPQALFCFARVAGQPKAAEHGRTQIRQRLATSFRIDFQPAIPTSTSIWYFLSLLGTVFLIVGLALPGAALSDLCLPWRLRPGARLFLAPLLGLALLVLLATLTGWVARGGYRWWFCLPLTVALILLGASRVRLPLWRTGLLTAARLTTFCAIASFPFLGQVWQYGAFNPFNDTFTYLVHAQWLQAHGFAEPALVSGSHPAWTQVASYQDTGLRMGASFLLGWLQAASGREWSWEVYPAVVSAGLVAGALTVGASVLAACPGQRRAAWLAALAAAVSLDGFAIGPVQFGFLPQTFGLAFGGGALALRGLEIASGGGSNRAGGDSTTLTGRLRAGLPAALLLAASVFCYSEFAPFLALAWVGSYLLTPPWVGSLSEFRARLTQFWPSATLALLLLNAELLRAWQALRWQAGVVVGTPVPWPAWKFLAHALGLHTAKTETADWWWQVQPRRVVLALPAVAAFCGLLGGVRRAPARSAGGATRRFRPAALVPAGLLCALCALAFLWFRYGAANPWPHGIPGRPAGVGQSWSQFKLSQWTSLAAIALALAGGVAALSARGGTRGRALAVCVLAGWCAIGLGWNGQKMPRHTDPFRHSAGTARDPFRVYLALRNSLAATVPPGDRIYLALRDREYEALKSCELLTYFLHDRPLAGDWPADPGLLAEFLPEAERHVAADHCAWVVRLLPAGGFVVERSAAAAQPP